MIPDNHALKRTIRERLIEERARQLYTPADEDTELSALLWERAKDKASAQYETKERWESRNTEFYRALGLKPTPELTQFEEAVGQILSETDQCIEVLLKVAEREGLDAALSTESQHAAIREIYPTSVEFVASRKRLGDATQGYVRELQTLLQQTAEPDIWEFLETYAERELASMHSLLEKQAKEQAAAIYGVYS